MSIGNFLKIARERIVILNQLNPYKYRNVTYLIISTESKYIYKKKKSVFLEKKMAIYSCFMNKIGINIVDIDSI